MRRISRLPRSIDGVRVQLDPISQAVPRSSISRAPTFSTSTPSRDKEENLNTSEKWRRRIWGTDKPPGAADPYDSGNSFVADQVRKQNEKRAKAKFSEKGAAGKEPNPDSRVRRAGGRKSYVDDISYEPAKTWTGLQVFGEEPQQSYSFNGFLTNQKHTSADEASVALRRAIVEALLLNEAGFEAATPGATGIQTDMTREAIITFVDGQPSIHFPSAGPSKEEVIQRLVESSDNTQTEYKETAVETDPTEAEEDVVADRSDIDPLKLEEEANKIENEPTESEEDVDADRPSEHPLNRTSGLQSEETAALVASWDPIWQDVSIESPGLKFAVIKRAMQLTGIHIPDSSLNSITNVQSLLQLMTKRPKPKKLADELTEMIEELQLDLPNVKIMSSKITEMDKETELGRWKVIRAELKRKGLPVYGQKQARRAN